MRLIDADEAAKTLKRMASELIRSENYREGEEYAIAAAVLSREGLFAHLTGEDVNEQFRKLEKERDELKEALGLMVYQYCVSDYDCPRLNHQYMTAGETAFRVLGLEQYDGVAGLEEWLFPECEPSEELEPVVPAHWTRDGDCSVCHRMGLYDGNEAIERSRFCPHCGAKMDVKEKRHEFPC